MVDDALKGYDYLLPVLNVIYDADVAHIPGMTGLPHTVAGS